jgi:very-short-patch-repair endonuclease
MRRAPTDAERALWRILHAKRLAGYKFKRQIPIDSYIVDFVCLGRRLIVEADGSQHGEEADAVRDRYLRSQGFRIERYWNNDILGEREKVTTAILNALEKCGSPDSPLPPTASRWVPPSPARGEGY